MIRRRHLRTRAIKMLVLDESDEMLNKGFKEQIYDVYRYLPPATQVYIIEQFNLILNSYSYGDILGELRNNNIASYMHLPTACDLVHFSPKLLCFKKIFLNSYTKGLWYWLLIKLIIALNTLLLIGCIGQCYSSPWNTGNDFKVYDRSCQDSRKTVNCFGLHCAYMMYSIRDKLIINITL